MVVIAAAWILLSTGTLWLNAGLDRDEGQVLFGEAAPVPPNIERYAYCALALAVLMAFAVHLLGGLCALGCAVMSLGYSHPTLAWKGHPVGGPLVNVLGYGVLSPVAGWSLVEVSPTPRSAVALALIAVWVLGWYFAAQGFQEEEDRTRGYRTFVAVYGSERVLQAARLCMGLGLAGTSLMTLLGWFPRVCLLSIPFFLAADVWLVRWIHRGGGSDTRWAKGLVRRLMLAGSVLVLLVCAQYVRDSLNDAPVAGLGTAGGHPPDRPIVPPSVMRHLERQGLPSS